MHNEYQLAPPLKLIGIDSSSVSKCCYLSSALAVDHTVFTSVAIVVLVLLLYWLCLECSVSLFRTKDLL